MPELTRVIDGSQKHAWLRIVSQDKVWVDVFGVEHRIQDMEPSYRENAARHLLRKGLEIVRMEEAILNDALSTDGLLAARGDEARASIEAELRVLANTSSADYVQATPLYKALTEANR